jgi:hypothetical protein
MQGGWKIEEKDEGTSGRKIISSVVSLTCTPSLLAADAGSGSILNEPFDKHINKVAGHFFPAPFPLRSACSPEVSTKVNGQTG